MAGSGRLQSDALFQGLTRPTMIVGVSYMYFVANAMITMMCFINLQSFKVFFVFVAVHSIGMIICMKEPRAMEMFIIKMQKGLKCINHGFHNNTNSYDVC
jgi:type IV secretion system protein VirB3